MKSPSIAVLAAIMLVALCALADDKPPKMSKQTRMDVIRSLNAELVYVRTFFPMGKDGLTLKNGAITPGEREIESMVAQWGPAAKPGDRVRITNVEIKDKHILFEINGGPVKKKKWYERITISGVGASASVADPTANPDNNPRGSYVRLEFDHHVPELTGDQIRQLLDPVFNWKAKSAAEAFIDRVPPLVRDAIKNHRVLVGMNREMVGYAKGRPPRRLREKDGEIEYEEWIYGEPPQTVEFVRFIGDEVVRVTEMAINGEKVVRAQKEIDLKTMEPPKQEKDTVASAPPSPAKRPTLRREGEPPLPVAGEQSAAPPRNPDNPENLPPGDTRRRRDPGQLPGTTTGAPPPQP